MLVMLRRSQARGGVRRGGGNVHHQQQQHCCHHAERKSGRRIGEWRGESSPSFLSFSSSTSSIALVHRIGYINNVNQYSTMMMMRRDMSSHARQLREMRVSNNDDGERRRWDHPHPSYLPTYVYRHGVGHKNKT